VKVVAHVPAGELLKGLSFVEEIVSLGVGVELQFTSEVLDALRLDDMANLRRCVGLLPLTIHGPFLDLNPGSFDSYILSATRKRFEEALTVAKLMEAELLVLHTGYHPARKTSDYPRWLETAVETFSRLSSCRVKVAIENVFEPDPSCMVSILEALPENFGVCIDVGHLNIYSRAPIEEWFTAFKDRLLEVHIHDNDGRTDAHLPVGEGSVDFSKVFELLKGVEREYIFNLENKTVDAVRRSLKALRRMGKWLLK
jgi:sugar phosphate isomerase/epimerase